jgi:lipoprotein-anchoring transpeptidase ErfK/SrfK
VDVHPVINQAQVQAQLHITSSPPQTGAWYWIDSTTVHYRPKQFWAPGTTVAVSAKVYGLNPGGGVYGAQDHTATYHVHDSWIATADGASKQMEIRHNGAFVKTMPLSLGALATPTHTGIHIVSSKHPSIVMDSCTFGVCQGQPGYYKETVKLDARISNDGEFVAAAPWSDAQQGHSNVSHGCVNLSPANAQWFYDTSVSATSSPSPTPVAYPCPCGTPTATGP